MNKLTLTRLLCLVVFTIFSFQGCEDQSSFGKDTNGSVLPTNLSYPDIIGYSAFSQMETAAPTYDSNGQPVMFEIVSIAKDGVILDETYLNAASIVNYELIETEFSLKGDKFIIITPDIAEAGKIIIEEGNPFANGDYYFSIKASVKINNQIESVIFENALHLQVGWADGISYCPFKVNFVTGAGTVSEAAEILGGRDNVRFELGSDQEKLSIDPVTGAISVNSSYTITETEYLSPVIKLIYESNPSVPLVYDGRFIAVLSNQPVELEREIDYFFYPKLKATINNNTAAGGDGYSVDIGRWSAEKGFVKKEIYRTCPGAEQLNEQEALDTRAEAGVDGITGLRYFTQGPNSNKPFESWFIADAVNLVAYSGCYKSELVFWIKQNHFPDTEDYFTGKETPLRFLAYITDNYTGDVATTEWTQVNDDLTCKIAGTETEFLGTPYPFTGTREANVDAYDSWVKCKLDLADYGGLSNFTIAFKQETSYDEPVVFPSTASLDKVRINLYISDLHYVAKEIQ
ncbi:hypothetical protein [Gaetbulibacter saemankumensis]|uniref:hypothetical protein n=1 Tax=Gaetbulibacter saemankumensis TaxID=311208 RepID=UPI00048501D4|nr:hypothetical protein [Gaetbulibacter saemankumensis]